MSIISHVKIRGFRRLVDLDLAVRPLTVLIGANGAGKTSLLDALSLVSASASGKLNESVSESGGIGSLLTRDRASELSLTVQMDVPDYSPLVYELGLTPGGHGYRIHRELLSQSRDGHRQPFKHINSADGDIRYYKPEKPPRGGLVRPDWEHNPLETSLSQVPKMFRQPEELRRILSSTTQYHALDVGPRAPSRYPSR